MPTAVTVKLLGAFKQGDAIVTDLEMTIGTYPTFTLQVTHPRVATKAEMLQNVKNRAASEKTRLDSEATIETLFPNIINETFNFNIA